MREREERAVFFALRNGTAAYGPQRPETLAHRLGAHTCVTLRDILRRARSPAASCSPLDRPTMKRLLLAMTVLGAALLSGCGVVAAPCRVASAGLKMVPLVGHVAAAPTDACADIID